MKTTYKLERTTSYEKDEQYTDFKIWTVNDTETWPQVLKNMVLWLSSIYGYEVLKHVKIMGEPLNEVALEDSLLKITGWDDECQDTHHCGQDSYSSIYGTYKDYNGTRPESFGDSQ